MISDPIKANHYAENDGSAREKIGTGYRVGALTVENATAERKNGYIVWRCRCGCGGEIMLDTRCLQRKTVKDCGCGSETERSMPDLTGLRFKKLVCLEESPEKDRSGHRQWLCRCDCGNLCLSSVSQLLSGNKKSCGCLRRPTLKQFVGKRFGKLTVIGYAGKENGMHRWKCLCDCGNETIVGQTLLQSGSTKSCGCLKVDQLRKNLNLIDGTSVTILKRNRDREPIVRNTSGYNGVYRNKKIGKWAAQITFKKKTYYLGCYSDLQDAVEARKRGEEMYDNFLEWYNNRRKAEKEDSVKAGT